MNGVTEKLEKIAAETRVFRIFWIVAFLCLLYIYFQLETRIRWVERYKDQGLVLVPMKEFVELRKAVEEMKDDEEETQQNEPPGGGSDP